MLPRNLKKITLCKEAGILLLLIYYYLPVPVSPKYNYNHAAVIVQQLTVRDAGAALARHADYVAT